MGRKSIKASDIGVYLHGQYALNAAKPQEIDRDFIKREFVRWWGQKIVNDVEKLCCSDLQKQLILKQILDEASN